MKLDDFVYWLQVFGFLSVALSRSAFVCLMAWLVE